MANRPVFESIHCPPLDWIAALGSAEERVVTDIRIAEIEWEGLEGRNLEGTVRFRGGRLEIELDRFELGKGNVRGRLTIDTTDDPPAFTLELLANDISIDDLRYQDLEGLLTDGNLDIRLRFDLRGYGGTYFRRSLYRHPKADRLGAVREALGIAPNIEVRELECTDPRDYSRDATAEVRAFAWGYVAGGDRLRMFRLPLLSHPLGKWLVPDLRSASGPKKRIWGLRLRATRLIEYEGTVLLPAG